MVFRFWAPASKVLDPAIGEPAHSHNPGVLALIEDVVASKRGSFFVKNDQMYVTGLRQVADALVVSRQVQLGMEGFRKSRGTGPLALSIAIDARDEPSKPSDPEAASSPISSAFSPSHSEHRDQEPPHDLLTLLKLSKPAQVLVTHELCQRMAAIRGLPLTSFPSRFGVSEYLWTSEDKLDLFRSEPQLTLAALPSPIGPSSSDSEIIGVKTNDADASHGMTRAEIQPSITAQSWLSRRSTRSYMVGVAVFVTICVAIVAVRIGFPRSSEPATSRAHAPSQQPDSGPKVSAEGPLTPPVDGSAEPLSPNMDSKSETKQGPTAEKRNVLPSRPSENCTLVGPLAHYNQIAEQARASGDYKMAKRRFEQVLACDSRDTTAIKGLNKTKDDEELSVTRH